MISDSRIGQYWRTVRHLRPQQIRNRISRRLFRPSIPSNIDCSWRFLAHKPFFHAKKRQCRPKDNEFTFLNKLARLSEVGWQADGLPLLWRYNLHYFDWLCEESPKWQNPLIEEWIENNPIGDGTGWDPYPISLRLVNWGKWYLSGGTFDEKAIQSFGQQVEWLSQSLEYHLLANHLWANAKALLFAGSVMQGVNAERWRARGLELFERELETQVLHDGGHYERSVVYHSIMTEDLLDIISVSRSMGFDIPSLWLAKADAMMRWLSVMTRNDGNPVLFNDGAQKISLDFKQLVVYAEKLGVSADHAVELGMRALVPTGFARYEGSKYTIFLNLAPMEPSYNLGHAHADIGTFELTIAGVPVVVDVGTSTYEATARRDYERSTAAHNVVEVGKQSQSEMWGAFRVGRRARIISREIKTNKVKISHNGYAKIGVDEVRRQFDFSPDSIKISDTLIGKGYLKGTARFYFAPEFELVFEDAEQTVLRAGRLKIIINGANTSGIKKYKYSPEFYKYYNANYAWFDFENEIQTNWQIQ